MNISTSRGVLITRASSLVHELLLVEGVTTVVTMPLNSNLPTTTLANLRVCRALTYLISYSNLSKFIL